MRHRIFPFLLLSAVLLLPQMARATNDCTFTTVDTTMILQADCTTDATIYVPDGFTLDGNGFTITAEDPASGHFLGAVVKNSGTTAHVKNLTLDTYQLKNTCDPSSPTDTRLRGILFESADGSITDNTVNNINQFFATGGSGCQEGNGIEVRNAPFDGTHPDTRSVNISGNTVSNYQKTGVVANGDVAVTITDNTVTGFGATNAIAQNGIQLGYGAKGIVMRNHVDGNWYGGTNWTATGILIFEADDVMVHQNEVSASQAGVAIETWGCFSGGPATASENRVMQNTISGAEWGAYVQSVSWPPYSTCDSAVDNNKIVNNTISGASGAGDAGVGIYAVDYDGSDALSATAYNNKAIRNSISGFTYSVDDYGSSASKVHANVTDP